MPGSLGLGSGTIPRATSSEFAGAAEREGVWSKPSNSGFAGTGGACASAGIVVDVPARVFKYHSKPRGPSGGSGEAGAGEGRAGFSATDAATGSESLGEFTGSRAETNSGACDLGTKCVPGLEGDCRNSRARRGSSSRCSRLAGSVVDEPAETPA